MTGSVTSTTECFGVMTHNIPLRQMSTSRLPIQARTRHMKMMAPMVYEFAGDGGSSVSVVLLTISVPSTTTTILQSNCIIK